MVISRTRSPHFPSFVKSTICQVSVITENSPQVGTSLPGLFLSDHEVAYFPESCFPGILGRFQLQEEYSLLDFGSGRTSSPFSLLCNCASESLRVSTGGNTIFWKTSTSSLSTCGLFALSERQHNKVSKTKVNEHMISTRDYRDRVVRWSTWRSLGEPLIRDNRGDNTPSKALHPR